MSNALKEQKISPKNFLNMFSQKNPVSRLLSSRITTSNLSDAMKHVKGENGVLTGVKPVTGNMKVVGKATTVKTRADDWGTAIKGIYAARKGDVLLIECNGDDPAVWGELASGTAQDREIAATVIYGSARDIAGIKELNYPVFSRDVIPNAGEAKGEGEVNIPVACGETTVNPGDLIMGDGCGVVAVPQEIIDEVIEEAFNIVEGENEIVTQIAEGSSFLDILNME
jgi:3-hexulose-6-phosphate synthase